MDTEAVLMNLENGEPRMPSGKEEGAQLEKKIHKAALLETVAVMNDVADGKKVKRSKKKVPGKAGKRNEEENEGNKQREGKDTRKKADKNGLTPKKQQRNAQRKISQECFKAKNAEKHEETVMEKGPGKMTRKERRLEKQRSRGKGPSSKEYYEKFIKKGQDDRPKKGALKDMLPSKRKEDFPSNDESKRKRPLHQGRKK